MWKRPMKLIKKVEVDVETRGMDFDRNLEQFKKRFTDRGLARGF